MARPLSSGASPLLVATLAAIVGLSASCGASSGGAENGDAGTRDVASSSGGESGSGSGADSGGGSGSSGGAGSASAIPNCKSGGSGVTDCGPNGGESCCASLDVTGGTFDRTYANSGDGGTGEADPATVSGFRLDKYLVTVGRFRQFVNAWNGGAGYKPAAGSGKHTHLNGGKGLANSGVPGTYEPGWVASDDGNVSPNDGNLACLGSYDTWTSIAGSQESLPINCVNWWEAYAFCIWDGGFLPSEAEWEYAAAGGSQQREYPWGSADPGSDNGYAIYGCNYPTTQVCMTAPVGTTTLGAGLFGQLDLAGDVFEWNLDGNAAYVDPCTDCANLPAGPGASANRICRGGNFTGPSPALFPPVRSSNPPTYRNHDTGLRCARTP